MIPTVGQRWLYTVSLDSGKASKVIFEILLIEGDYASCLYVQVIYKGFNNDYVGYVDRIGVPTMQTNTVSFTYLDGQDKP